MIAACFQLSILLSLIISYLSDWRENMAMSAMAIPILPGKKDLWKMEVLEKMIKLNKAETDAIREEAGVHERTFLQETPNGDFVILTFEGEDPVAGWGKIMQSMPPELASVVAEIHGFDTDAPPPPMPMLVYDSKA
jgi:hypothetical protein